MTLRAAGRYAAISSRSEDITRQALHFPPHKKTRLNRVIFPQMSNWLPPHEREQLCFAFESELKRLNLAA
ncbi:MAG: hypothetical protein ACKVON_00015 [Beijerinckiaceae bacterium]